MGISLNPATLLSGQGIDVSSLVTQILNQKGGQLQQWQEEQSTLQVQAGDLTAINSDLNNLATAISALSDPLGVFAALGVTSSNPDVLTATSLSSAQAGTHQIVVSTLASQGSVYTDPVANGDTSFLANGVASGDIKLQVGGTTHDIAITAGSNDTLNTLATYINNQNWGVAANVVTDANGSRLTLFSQATGTPGALAITNNDTTLSFNPPSGGTNASLTIDGVPYSSTTNTITSAIPGVTLSLASADPGNPVQVTIGANSQSVLQAINNFVSAYNQVIGDINQQFAVNPNTNTQGPLGSDSSLRQLQSSLLNDVTYAVGGSNYANLAGLGINMNDDGTLTVDSSQLTNALATDPSGVQNFFQNAGVTGFANNFHTDLNNLTDSTQGILTLDLAQNTAQQTDISNSITNFETQLLAQQQQLTAQFSQVNATLQAYPLLLQQVTETLAVLGGGGSGSSSSPPTLTSGL